MKDEHVQIFVALNLKNKQIIIVEVTEYSNINNLLDCIRNRQNHRYNSVMRKPEETSAINEQWKPRSRFIRFIRKANMVKAENTFHDENDVTFIPIEDAAFPWTHRNEREGKGL
ncbi:hypothetical protein [Acetobacter oeni]|uniref:Uncharacterized protein n=1 Tax=Acetobacter oeni TaxID=304077 RepID=A0A511XIU4_9PROT|nr:hypothetical protein [Acetobacter oeni]MBB3881939.1 hypothetical protein [Acetobacter oeni]NHO17740.1 hypothetical protein [Acetobacter oeni]GEN62831.1 hypothetical protein AOE01nite_10550 [Acetobacter oeni]